MTKFFCLIKVCLSELEFGQVLGFHESPNDPTLCAGLGGNVIRTRGCIH